MAKEMVTVFQPTGPTSPVVADSPHSGRVYPPDFVTCVDKASLQQLEDGFVDQLIGGLTATGATVVLAQFPRAYIDPNRAEHDLDPTLIDGPWLKPLLPSTKTELGVGLIFRRTLDGRNLYSGKLTPQAIRHRLDTCYLPYHAHLKRSLDAVYAEHGQVIHLNCHSMPSLDGPTSANAANKRPDFCLGNRHGTTASETLMDQIEGMLQGCGYRVSRNVPYAGVELVRRYAEPECGRHSVQIEINRALYMDEQTHQPHDGLVRIQAVMTSLASDLAQRGKDALCIAAE